MEEISMPRGQEQKEEEKPNCHECEHEGTACQGDKSLADCPANLAQKAQEAQEELRRQQSQ